MLEWPSIPTVPPVIPSDIQKAALSELQNARALAGQVAAQAEQAKALATDAAASAIADAQAAAEAAAIAAGKTRDEILAAVTDAKAAAEGAVLKAAEGAIEAAAGAARSAASLFSNPLAGKVDEMANICKAPGGLQLADMTSVLDDITSFKLPETIPGADELNNLLTTELTVLGTEWQATAGNFGLDTLSAIGGAPSLQSFMDTDIKGLLQQQTEQVVGKMQSVVATVGSVAQAKSMFGNINPDGTAEKSICDNIKDFAGSLGGAVDGFIDSAQSAMGELGNMFNKVSESTKTVVNNAVSALKTKFAELKNMFAGVLSGIGTELTAQVRSAIDGVKSAFSGLKAGVESFMGSVAAAAGKAIGELKDIVGGLVASAKEGLMSMADKIKSELKELAKAFDFLKDVSLVMTFPTLSPCAKQIVGACAGAAGAISIVNLVS